MSEVGTQADRLDAQLCEVLDRYLAGVDEGVPGDPQALIAAYPELAEPLGEFFSICRQLQTCQQAGLTFGEDLTDPDPSLHSARGARTAMGRHVGDYLLIERLDSGGMGVVYRAWQRRLNRVVALKILGEGRLATEVDRLRFQVEIEAAASLDHPSIVPIYETGHVDGYYFYSMRFIEGSSLSRRLEHYRERPREAAELVATVARAVDHAHQRGVLHRDLKPSNILVDAEGRPHVADFGLAKRAGGPDLTRTDDVLGSPPYMSPEQAAGNRAGTTTATDVYGLGAILYALLTGRAPFLSPSPLTTLDQVRNQPPVLPRSLDSRIDRDLQTVCLKCLEKAPSVRYPSALALADDLERWLAGLPIHARPATWGQRLRLWSQHPDRQQDAPMYALVIGLVQTVCVIYGILATFLDPDSPREAAGVLPLLFGWLGIVYLPVVVFAALAARGHRWALYAGLVPAMLGLGTLTAFVAGMTTPGTAGLFDRGDPIQLAANHTVFLANDLLVVLSFAIGVISATAHRPRGAEAT